MRKPGNLSKTTLTVTQGQGWPAAGLISGKELMAVSATNSALGGLSRRLVQDGLITEDAVLQALKGAQAQRITLVAYLVGRQMIEARKIAVAAASEFGVPLLDLDAIDIDMEVSTASRALLTIAPSLSCSTMMGSTRMPDWNLISSMAYRKK